MVVFQTLAVAAIVGLGGWVLSTQVQLSKVEARFTKLEVRLDTVRGSGSKSIELMIEDLLAKVAALEKSREEILLRLDKPQSLESQITTITASLQKASGDIKALLARLDKPLVGGKRIEDVLAAHEMANNQHYAIAAAYEKFVLGSISTSVKKLLREVSIKFMTHDEVDLLRAASSALSDLVMLYQKLGDARAPSAASLNVPELNTINQLLDGLLSLSRVHVEFDKVAEALRTGSAKSSTRSQVLQVKTMIKQANDAWNIVLGTWSKLDKTPGTLRFLAEASQHGASRAWDISVYTENVRGVLDLHLHRAMGLEDELREQQGELGEPRPDELPGSEAEVAPKDAGVRPTTVLTRSDLLDTAEDHFKAATIGREGDPSFAIAQSNLSVVIGRKFQRDLAGLAAKDLSVDGLRKKLEGFRKQYQAGVAAITAALDTSATTYQSPIQRSIFMNNLATWHYEMARCMVTCAQKLQKNGDWLLSVRTPEGGAGPLCNVAEITRLLGLARGLIEDAKAVPQTVASVYITDMEIASMEVTVGRKQRLPYMDIGEAGTRRAHIRSVFSSMRSAVARNAFDILRIRKEDVLTGESIVDFRPLFQLMDIGDSNGLSPELVEERCKDEFLREMGSCIGQDWARK